MIDKVFANVSLPMIIKTVLVFVIAGLIAAYILRMAVDAITKQVIPFRKAYLTVLLYAVIGVAFSYICGLILQAYLPTSTIASWVARVMCFFIQSGVISWRIKIRFGKACLVSLLMLGIVLALLMIVALAVVLIRYFWN